MTTYYYKVGWEGYEDRDAVLLSHTAYYCEVDLTSKVEHAYSRVMQKRLEDEKGKEHPGFIFQDYPRYMEDVAKEMVSRFGFARAEPLLTCSVIANEYHGYSYLPIHDEVARFNDSLE